MTQPNIIFVFSDQQRYNTLGCTGSPVIKTPAFDRLAAEGLLFRQAFSSCPICSPYRGQIVTGKYSHKNGVVDNEYKLYDGQTTIAHALKSAGYRTAFVGKWHLGHGPYTPENNHGFDHMAAYNCGHRYYEMEYWENERGPIPIDGWSPIRETDLAIAFMEDHKRQRGGAPFFLAMCWAPPHWPYDQYPKEYAVYRPDEVDVAPNVPEQMEAFARKEIANYYGNITGLDAQMARLLDWLNRSGLRENTLVCYSSDHGDHLSSHGYGKPMDRWMHHTMRASKATPYEESVHIPFILSYPARVQAGAVTDVLFSSVDVMPTLLSLAGVGIPDGVQGTDLSHVVLGAGGPEPDSVYLQILGPGWPNRSKWVGYWRGLRTDRWLYARWHDSDQVLLFDRENDPYEMTNLAANPDYSEVRQELEERLRRWMRETDDPFDTGERDEIGMLRLGQQFTHEKWIDYPRTA